MAKLLPARALAEMHIHTHTQTSGNREEDGGWRRAADAQSLVKNKIRQKLPSRLAAATRCVIAAGEDEPEDEDEAEAEGCVGCEQFAAFAFPTVIRLLVVVIILFVRVCACVCVNAINLGRAKQ